MPTLWIENNYVFICNTAWYAPDHVNASTEEFYDHIEKEYCVRCEHRLYQGIVKQCQELEFKKITESQEPEGHGAFVEK